MTSTADTPDTDRLIDPSELGRLVGTGGQGDVFAWEGHAGVVVKLYHGHVAVDVAGLDRLIAWRASLPPTARAFLDARAAWPRRRLVTTAGRLGFVMAVAPQPYRCRRPDGSSGLRDIQLAYTTTAELNGGSVPSVRERVHIVHRFARLLHFLHERGVTYPDLNHANLLYRVRPRPEVFLLDCDSCGLAGAPRTLRLAEARLWQDPRRAPGNGSGRDRAPDECEIDRFKLALLFLRVYFRRQAVLDGVERLELPLADMPLPSRVRHRLLPLDPPLTFHVRDLLERGLGHRGERPGPGEWARALAELDHVLAAARRWR